MVDLIKKAAVVRNEIAEVMKSDRLCLIGSCEAHVFKLEDGKWIDLTAEPVLVHLIRDNLEGMTKMLAIHTHKMIIDNVPVSSNFNVFTSSKKFLQFVCNKFDKNTDNYGFGFAGLHELEMFLQLLNRIKQTALDSLTPSCYTRDAPPLSPYPNVNVASLISPHLSIASNGITAPYGYAGSPMKPLVPHTSEYETAFNNAARMYGLEDALSGLMLGDMARPRFTSESFEGEKLDVTPSDIALYEQLCNQVFD